MPVDGAIIGMLITAFWVWMLIDCLFNTKLNGGSKVGWALFIIFTQIVGAMIYFFVRCNNHNPVEAVASYYKTVMQWSQQQLLLLTPTRLTIHQNHPCQRNRSTAITRKAIRHTSTNRRNNQAIVPLNQVPNAQQTIR